MYIFTAFSRYVPNDGNSELKKKKKKITIRDIRMDKNINSVGKNCIVEEGRGQIYRDAEEERD